MSLQRTLLTALAAAAATLTGIGLARFAWTPLVPALVHAHWFSPQQTAYLGAANLLGYLLGAAGAHRISLRWRAATIILFSYGFTVLSFIGCAWPLPFLPYALLRLIAGVTGALLMVLAPASVLAVTPPRWRARVGSLIFTGIGLGIIFAGSALPALASTGPRTPWLVLAAITAVLMLAGWRTWRGLQEPRHDEHATATHGRLLGPAVVLALLAYGLDAVGFVPHALFWVDYIARELHRGLITGGHYWTLFGIGALIGPLLAGELARVLGFRRAFALVLTTKALCAGLPFFLQTPWALALSSIGVGAMVPGSVTMASGRVTELAPPARQKQIWGWMTAAFAVTQAIAAYGMSWLYSVIGTYHPLFGIAGASLLVAAGCAALPVRGATQSRTGTA